MEDVITAIEQLGEMDEDALSSLIDSDKQTYLRLLMAVGALVTKCSGNLNKLYEKTTELSLSIADTKREVQHVRHSYGPDLRVKDEETGLFVDEEIKSSVVKKGKKGDYKSNWIFSVSGDATLESLSKKYSGTVRLLAINGIKVFKEYLLSGRFVSLYIAKCISRRKEEEKTKKDGSFVINLGGAYCEKCDTYHRITKYIQYDTLLNERDNDASFTSEEWNDLLKRATVCGTVIV